MEYRSIKELLDAFCPDMEYRPVSGGNQLMDLFATVENVANSLDSCHYTKSYPDRTMLNIRMQ